MLKQYKELDYEDIIESEYCHLTGRSLSGSSSFLVPSISEMVEETWRTCTFNLMDEKVREALDRNDHEIHGLSKFDFANYAYNGSIDIQYDPLDAYAVQAAVFEYLSSRYMCYADYNNRIVHSSIKEVW